MAGYGLNVKIEGLEQLAGTMKGFPTITRGIYRTMIDNLTKVAQEEAVKNAPTDTGTLLQSITTRIGLQSQQIVGEVFMGEMKPYFAYQEYGTGIYGYKAKPITPTKGEYLNFRLKDGTWIRTKSVKGVPAKGFMKKGRELASQKTPEEMAKAKTKLVSYFLTGK